MQVQKVRVAGGVELRPSRLNFAGWCLWCTRRFCEDAVCVARHAGSSWEVCSRCEGAEYMDVHGVMERCDCVGGLTESADGELAEVLEFPAVDAEPGWVVTVPRNDDPAQLVPRGDVSAYVQAVLPVAGSPELEAAARANPTDPATGFAAFGACY